METPLHAPGRPYIWRGPFAVVRDGQRKWKIINRYGETERVGYNYKGAADEECRLRNLAQAHCDQSPSRAKRG